MMKALAITAAAILMSAPALADNAPTTTGNAMPQTMSAPSANRFTTNQGQNQWLVGNLWDKNVYNSAGKSIGNLKDVLIDKDGRVSAVIVGVGGFLGLGEKDVAIDYGYLQQNGGISPSRITIGMTEEDLRNAPSFVRSSN